MTRAQHYALVALIPPLAWFASQQALSFILHAACPEGWRARWAVVALLLLGLLAIVSALPMMRHASAGARWGGAFWTGMFVLAIVFQGLGILILQGCRA